MRLYLELLKSQAVKTNPGSPLILFVTRGYPNALEDFIRSVWKKQEWYRVCQVTSFNGALDIKCLGILKQRMYYGEEVGRKEVKAITEYIDYYTND